MRLSRRRFLCLFATTASLLAGLWVCVAHMGPGYTVKSFEVHGSAEILYLLQDYTPANCTPPPPGKLDLPPSDLSVLMDIRDFRFRMNHPPCQGHPVLLTLVHSAPHNREKRMQIRHTWGSVLRGGSLLFVLGQVDSPLLQLSLEAENDRYHDLLQGNFRDAYRNMTYKHIMALKWALYYCPGALYVLKTDDDTFVNAPLLLRALSQGRARCGMQRLMLCRVWRGVAVKRKVGKWTVTRAEFRGDVYPDYCSGTAILYSQDVVHALYKEAQNTPYFWVDDVHVTGTLARRLNLTHQPVGPTRLDIRITFNNTITCLTERAPPWVLMFLFSRHNTTAADMRTLWWFTRNCRTSFEVPIT